MRRIQFVLISLLAVVSGCSEHGTTLSSPHSAPFDVIIVAAAPDHVPRPLLDQLAPGGRLVIPVGRFAQELMLLEKRSDGSIRERQIAPVRFVPMTGEAGRGDQRPAGD